jgi:hypothetical protein
VFVGTSWVKPETSAAIGAMIAAIGSIGAAVAAAVALYFNKRSAQELIARPTLPKSISEGITVWSSPDIRSQSGRL